MKKVLIAIVIILILLLGAGYLIGSQMKENNNSKNQPYPKFIDSLILKLKNEPVANPPTSISKCLYENKIVYYLPPKCCDQPSVLFNDKGNYICAPDGGFTGNGDGKCDNFFEQRTNCEKIWQDERKYGTQ